MKSGQMKSAIVLLSGGLDSATALAIARSTGFRTYALSVHYGQRHVAELDAAARVAAALGAHEHRVMGVDLAGIGGSALTDSTVAIPEAMSPGIPVTYVPARNTLLLSLALGWAEVVGAGDIFVGVNFLDYSGYPDCRPAYYDAFNQLIGMGTKQGEIRVVTPLIAMRKSEIVQLGVELGAPFHVSWSCYSGETEACGVCESCVLRLRAFREAGAVDQLPYAVA